MTSAFSTPHNRKMTLILLAICSLLAIAAVAVGIDDNLPGILLAFLAATAFVLAFVHPWRTAKKFLFLLLASVLGFVLYIILNIILDSVAQNPATSGALQDLIQSPVVNALSLIIAMVCPAAFIVGAVGSVVMFIRSHRQTT
jgi:membrane-anchored glycerophosphoryl diester phosphodiesterase (GDPDase)